MYVYIFWASIYFDLLIYIFNICDDICIVLSTSLLMVFANHTSFFNTGKNLSKLD